MEGFSRRILVLALLASVACSADQKNGGGGGTTTALDPNGATTGCRPGAGLTEGAGTGGRITFSLAAGTDPCSVQGYVVGAQGTTSAARTGENEFVIEDVPEGDRDIIVTGATAGSTTQSVEPANTGGGNLQAPAAGVIGIRVNELEVVGGATLTKTLRLGAVGTIRGNAKLAGQADHTGIQVYVPGTSYAARTDAAGNYEIQQVVPGRHNLRFEFAGYGHALLEGVDVLPAGVGTAPAVVLFTGGGEGKIGILADDGSLRTEPLPILASRVVRYALQVQGAPRLMKISEDGNFANVEYQPFRSSGTYTFKVDPTSGGRLSKKLSVRTLDGTTENEIERAVVIDLFPEARAAGVLSVSATDANGTPILGLRATLTLPKNAVEMRISTRADFVGAAWEVVAASKTLPVTEEGDYAVFAQFRDVDLIASDVFSAAATVDLFPAGSLAFAIDAPVLTYPATPDFALTAIASPIKSEHIKLLFADNAEFLGAAEIAYSTAHTYNLGAKLAACGPRTLHLKARFTDPLSGTVILSDVSAKKDIRYRCADEVVSRQLQARHRATVASGGGMLFDWSGYFGAASGATGSDRLLSAEGGTYEIATGAWTPLNPVSAPQARADAKGWYRGGKFYVFGGRIPVGIGSNESDIFDGGIYDPAAKTWTKIPKPTAVATGDASCDTLNEQLFTPHIAVADDYIVMWGDTYNGTVECNGVERTFSFVYDLNAGTWTGSDSLTVPARCPSGGVISPLPTHVVAGTRLIQWGGFMCYGQSVDGEMLPGGEVLDLTTHTWSAMADHPHHPTYVRTDYASAWTGTEMIVWGGASRIRLGHAGLHRHAQRLDLQSFDEHVAFDGPRAR